MSLTKSQEFDFNTTMLGWKSQFWITAIMLTESKMLLKKKEEALGRKTTSNGVFLPVNYLRTGLPDKLWNPNHAVLLMI